MHKVTDSKQTSPNALTGRRTGIKKLALASKIDSYLKDGDGYA